MSYISKYFNLKTDPHLACPCCGVHDIKDKLYMTLDAIREHIGKPVDIISGYRCQKYNDSLPHSVHNSGHTTGEAADIHVIGYDCYGLGNAIKHMYKAGYLPYLQYCYLITWGSGNDVHVGVDIKPKRHSVFGF